MFFIHFTIVVNDINYLETYSSLKIANKRLLNIFETYKIEERKKNKLNNLNIDMFIKDISFPHKNMIIVDKGRRVDEKSVILIKNSNYNGFGYFNLNHQITNYNILESLITAVKPKKIYNKLVINYIKKNKPEKIINIEYLK